MTDRELLELAAKAAGIEYNFICPDGAHCGDMNTMQDRFWNPLEDDGDALRLAVKLGLLVSIQQEESLGNVEVHIFPEGRPSGRFIAESLGADPYTATRLAIVRAAAEIGKEMK